MPTTPPKTPGEAIARRLLADSAVAALVGDRVTPNLPEDEDETKPQQSYVVFQKVTGGAGNTLSTVTRLKNYLYRLDVYATTDEEAETILAACQDALFGNPRKNLPPWRELTDGVQGCFPQDDADADTLQDGSQANGQTFSLWFAPQV